MIHRHSRRHALTAVFAAVATLALGGCVLDYDKTPVPDAGAVTPTPAPAAGTTLTGQVYASNVNGSQVSVFAADATGGQLGAVLASATTDAQGRYTINFTTAPTGPLVVVATGGTYVSEADNSPQTLGSFTALVPALAAGANTAHLNPLTNTIAAATSSLLAGGGTTLAAALANATTAVNRLFGVTGLAGNPLTVAADATATAGDAWLLAALAGTLEQLRANAAVSAAALYQALRDDASDGKLDGLKGGQPVTIAGSGTLQSSLFTTQWSGAANGFAAAQPRYGQAAAAISSALQNSAQAAGNAIGSSGSIAPLLTQAAGTQIYFAARGDGLVKLDMSDSANPVATKLAAINSAVMRNTTVSPATGYFTSLDGIVINPTPINTPNGAKVFAILYSYQSKVVVSVNLTDGVVASTATLSIANSSGFSGASASIAGGIGDGKRSRIWLATGDGLLGIRPDDLTAAPISIPQPPNTQINENVGGDPSKDILYSPDYDNGGLVIFNLAEAKAYAMNATDWHTTVGSFATLSGEIDGVSLDSNYNVAVMNLEGGGTLGVLAYTTPTGATTTVGTLPVSTKFKAFTSNGSFAGSAIDPVSHTGLFVGEGSGLGVGVLDDPAGANWAGFSRFVRASTTSYRFEPHDPHTVGAFSVNSKPYGFLLQGSAKPYKVAVVDLTAWLAAPTNGGALITDPLLDATIVKLLSY